MNSLAESNHIYSHPLLILGLGTTGRSVLRWLLHRGMSPALISVLDDNWTPEKKKECEALGVQVCESIPADELMMAAFITPIRTVVVSPGIFPHHPIREACRHKATIQCVNDIQLWWWAIAQEVPTLLGITGSNGKSTVTAWAAEVATACGREAIAVGNIGVPVLDVLREIELGNRSPISVWVLELSSFQLEDCEPLPFTAAALLNISEDHLDYHGGIEAYRAAKERIFECAKIGIIPAGYNVSVMISQHFHASLTVWVDFGLGGTRSKPMWSLHEGSLWCGDRVIMSQSALHLLGDHNALNALVVLALLNAIGIDVFSDSVQQALSAFQGLAHRVKCIAQYHGVDFIDDSKGTNVGSTVAALEGLGSRYTQLVLIAGGDGKGQDFSPLVAPILRYCRKVFLIGRDAPLLEQQLASTTMSYQRYDSLEQAVESAFAEARTGEALVLSPACASLDMFRNYAHRAEVFCQSVQRCIGQAEHVSTH